MSKILYLYFQDIQFLKFRILC